MSYISKAELHCKVSSLKSEIENLLDKEVAPWDSLQPRLVHMHTDASVVLFDLEHSGQIKKPEDTVEFIETVT